MDCLCLYGAGISSASHGNLSSQLADEVERGRGSYVLGWTGAGELAGGGEAEAAAVGPLRLRRAAGIPATRPPERRRQHA